MLTRKLGLDEIRCYLKDEYIDPKKYSILILEMCLNDILYVLEPSILDMVWRSVGLIQCQTYLEMYTKLLDDSTNNEICNQIGEWARENDYNGIVFPSARYADKREFEEAKKENLLIVPEIDYIDLGSFFCGYEYAMGGANLSMQVRNDNQKNWILHAQPNLVLFDNSQLVALKDRFPIYYSIFDLNIAQNIRIVEGKSNPRLSDITTFIIDHNDPIKIGKGDSSDSSGRP